MPKANVWYGVCSYWTDDWDKLGSSTGKHSGIPLCPVCGAPGFIQPTEEWWAAVDAYEADGHPGYRAQVEATKETCIASFKSVVHGNDHQPVDKYGLPVKEGGVCAICGGMIERSK